MTGARFDVVLIDLGRNQDPQGTVRAIANALAIDAERATELTLTMPAVIRQQATSDEAEKIFHAMHAIGAKVELRRLKTAPVARPSSGGMPAADLPGLPPLDPPSSPPPPKKPIDPRLAAEAALAAPATFMIAIPGLESTRNAPGGHHDHSAVLSETAAVGEGHFYTRLPAALTAPFRGTGWRWLVLLAIYGIIHAITVAAASWIPLYGVVITILSTSFMIGLGARFFRACFWGELGGNGTPEPVPEVDAGYILQDLIRPGIVFFLFQAVSQVGAIVYTYTALRSGRAPVAIALDPLLWLMFFGPFLYWPVGLAYASVTTDTLGFLRFGDAMRLIFRAPVEYLLVILVGVVAFFVPVFAWVALFVVNFIFALLCSPLLIGLPMAVAHGAQGAAMAALIRSKPDAVED